MMLIDIIAFQTSKSWINEVCLVVLQTLVVLKPNWHWKQIRGEWIVFIYSQITVSCNCSVRVHISSANTPGLLFNIILVTEKIATKIHSTFCKIMLLRKNLINCNQERPRGAHMFYQPLKGRWSITQSKACIQEAIFHCAWIHVSPNCSL